VTVPRAGGCGLPVVAVTLTAAMLLAAVSARVGAQAAVSGARLQPELRADVIAARATAVEVGAGASAPLGIYVRLGLVAAAGAAWAGREARASGRIDAVARFLLDPFFQSRWAPYAGGGVSARYVATDERWRGFIALVVGLEGPRRGGTVPAVEVGLGGGARIGVALRRALPDRR
jgi:hypothetical protein